MTKEELRILRVFLEAMTTGLDMEGKRRTWERMAGADDYYKPLTSMKMGRDKFHELVLDGCKHAMKHRPSMDYAEAGEDAMYVDRNVESYLSTEELMIRGQKNMMANLRGLQKSKAAREDMARRVLLQLVD